MKILSSFALSALLLAGPFAPQAMGQDTGGQSQNADGYGTKKYQKKYASSTQSAAVTIAPIVQNYEPNPAIWKLADDDTTIYMFGTFHLLPEDFRWRSDAFNAIVDQSEELIVETTAAEGDAEIAAYMMELFTEMLSDNKPTVSSRLSVDNHAKWFSLADNAGVPPSFFDKMPVVISMMSVGMEFMQDQGSSFDHGVETKLEAEFAEAGKPIGSIEDGVVVLKSLLDVDENLFIAELDQDLTKWDGVDVKTLGTSFDDELPAGSAEDGSDAVAVDPFAMEHAWARGEVSKLGIDEFGGSEFGKLLYEKLLTDRNRAWAKWLEQRLEQPGTILLAVGAGHFEGKDSVQDMLEERNLTAERIH